MVRSPLRRAGTGPILALAAAVGTCFPPTPTASGCRQFRSATGRPSQPEKCSPHQQQAGIAPLSRSSCIALRAGHDRWQSIWHIMQQPEGQFTSSEDHQEQEPRNTRTSTHRRARQLTPSPKCPRNYEFRHPTAHIVPEIPAQLRIAAHNHHTFLQIPTQPPHLPRDARLSLDRRQRKAP